MNDPNDTTAGDAAHAVARAGLSALPLVGGPAVELFNAIVAPPLERRRAEWVREVGERLLGLEQEQRMRLEDLRHDEMFLDTVLQATSAALRSKAGAKRQALRNAVINTALGNRPDDALQQVFLGLVDRLTEQHIRVLGIAADPMAWIRAHGVELRRGAGSGMRPRVLFPGDLGFRGELLLSAVPELGTPALDLLWSDLHAAGLVQGAIRTTGARFVGEKDIEPDPMLTGLGQQFVAFISEAPQEP